MLYEKIQKRITNDDEKRKYFTNRIQKVYAMKMDGYGSVLNSAICQIRKYEDKISETMNGVFTFIVYSVKNAGL
jgi:hypothetical protein